MLFRLFIALFLLVAGSNFGLAQTQESDSSFLAQAMRYRRIANQNMLADNARLFNGTDYREKVIHDYDKGHPFFIVAEWQKGFIEYEGQRYENVDLLYDLVGNKILTHQYYTLLKIDLIQPKVSSFGIAGHNFINVLAGDSLSKLLKPGFYDLLVEGKTSLYAHREKEMTEDLSSGRIELEFRDKNFFYIVKNNKVFAIKSKRDLFKAMPENKVQIKARLSEQNIRFRKQLEAALVSAAQLDNQTK